MTNRLTLAIEARRTAEAALAALIEAEVGRSPLFTADAFSSPTQHDDPAFLAETARGLAAYGTAEAALRGPLLDPAPSVDLQAARLRAVADALDQVALQLESGPGGALPPLPEGVALVSLSDPGALHDAIAQAVGEPPATVPCPRCCEPMGPELIVCWPCFRATRRLDNVPANLELDWSAARCARGFHSHDGPCPDAFRRAESGAV